MPTPSNVNSVSAPNGNSPATGVTAQDVIRIADSKVGQYGATNEFTSWYGGGIGAGEWCDIFVSWVFGQAGQLSAIGGKFALTTAHAAWFKSQGRWGTTPQPGALAFFSWSGGKSISSIDHVGIATDSGNGSTVSTVEGNTGNNQVATRVRSMNNVVGFGYPKLDGSPLPSGVSPVGFNPVNNPLSGILGSVDVLSKLGTLASHVLNPKFWERIGIAALGLLIVAFGIVFVKRRQIESAIKTGAKVAAVV